MPEAKNMRRYLLEALNITGLSLVCIPIHVYSADLPVLTFDFHGDMQNPSSDFP